MENHGGIEGSSETYIVDMTTYRHIFGSDPLELPSRQNLVGLSACQANARCRRFTGGDSNALSAGSDCGSSRCDFEGPYSIARHGWAEMVSLSHLEISLHALRCVSTEPFGFRGACGATLDARMRKPLRDPRATVVGSFLRVWSIDEFPQFLNVLRGEMSLIGPRPIVEEELHLYGDQLNSYLSVSLACLVCGKFQVGATWITQNGLHWTQSMPEHAV